MEEIQSIYSAQSNHNSHDPAFSESSELYCGNHYLIMLAIVRMFNIQSKTPNKEPTRISQGRCSLIQAYLIELHQDCHGVEFDSLKLDIQSQFINTYLKCYLFSLR